MTLKVHRRGIDKILDALEAQVREGGIAALEPTSVFDWARTGDTLEVLLTTTIDGIEYGRRVRIGEVLWARNNEGNDDDA